MISMTTSSKAWLVCLVLTIYYTLPAVTQSSDNRHLLSQSAGFVYTQGPNLMLDGKQFYFAGTNAFYLGSTDVTSDDQVRTFFQVQSANGVRVVRFWGFVNGYGGGSVTSTPHPIQSSVGHYNEAGFKRIDLILSEAAKQDIKVIVTLANFEPQFGGIQWYVDQILGTGQDRELFYTNSQAMQYYRHYVSTLVYRTNTYTGTQYKYDATILSWELLNEPHTTDNYEKNRGLQPGKIVRDWLDEMSTWLKGIDSNHLISSGEEGYRADGDTSGNYANWINGGYKGVDFVGDINLPHIDFATVHVYPDNWGIPASEFEWVRSNVIADRASIAHAAGKPIIMEESGMKTGYVGSRSSFLGDMYQWANENNYAGTLVWQVYAWDYNDGQYDFNYQMDGAQAMWNQYGYMNSKS